MARGWPWSNSPTHFRRLAPVVASNGKPVSHPGLGRGHAFAETASIPQDDADAAGRTQTVAQLSGLLPALRAETGLVDGASAHAEIAFAPDDRLERADDVLEPLLDAAELGDCLGL